MKNILEISQKAKRLTKDSIANISKLPMQKILLGTAVTIIPGALVVTGAYVAGNRVIKKYKNYKENEAVPKGFMKWASLEASDGIVQTSKGVKNLTVKNVSKLMPKKNKKS